MSNLEGKGKTQKLQLLLFALIAFLVLSRIVFVFIFEKEGHHSDEAWSYGFANSFYQPYLYSDETDIIKTRENIANYNVWLDGSFFNDYLVVNDGEQFRFDSVIYNKSGDMSPSFYEILLHFVSSFYPNHFSWWFGFEINLLVFLLTEILLYVLCNKLSNSVLFSFVTALFYGLSRGAVDTVIYLRMYALLTMFTVLTIFLFDLVYGSKKNNVLLYLSLIATTALGAFTHFYYLMFAFFLTFFFCIFLFTKKDIKKGLLIGISMLTGVIMFFVLYPSAIKMLLSSGEMYSEYVDYPFSWVYTFCLNLFFSETLGIGWIVDKFFLLYVLAVFVMALVIVAGFSFVFRNEKWFISFKTKLVSRINTLKENRKGTRDYYVNEWNPLPLSCFVSVMMCIPIVATISHVESMGEGTDRYLFNMFPVFILVLFLTGYKLIYKLKKSRKAFTLIVCVMLVLLLFRQQRALNNSFYLFNKGDNKTDLCDFFENKNVIVASNTPFRMEWYSVELRKCKEAAFINPYKVENAESVLNNLNDNREYYLVVEKGNFISEEAVDEKSGEIVYDVADINRWNNTHFEKDFYSDLSKINPIFDDKELLFTQESFCGKLKIYKINTN